MRLNGLGMIVGFNVFVRLVLVKIFSDVVDRFENMVVVSLGLYVG